MAYSKAAANFVDLLVHAHAQYDFDSEAYELAFDDLASFDLEKLASLIIQDEPAYGREATGSDNPLYENQMLPALVLHLRYPFDQDVKNDFLYKWRKGVVEYCRAEITDLLQKSLRHYNMEHAA